MSAEDALEAAIRAVVTEMYPESEGDIVARWIVGVALVPSEHDDATSYVYLVPGSNQSLDVTLGLLEVTRRNLLMDVGYDQ